MELCSRESRSTRTSVDPAVALSIGATVNPTYPHSLPFPGQDPRELFDKLLLQVGLPAPDAQGDLTWDRMRVRTLVSDGASQHVATSYESRSSGPVPTTQAVS
jgi:hypothetical protein